MRNYLRPGKVPTYTAPAGGVVAGAVVLIGGLFVIASTTAAAGQTFAGQAYGVFALTKLAGEGALVEGQPVYWDVANARFSIDPSVGLPIGSMAKAALDADLTGEVRLHGETLCGRLLTFRKRVAIATINAGGTLLPALPGLKYRVKDEMAVAVGGAVGATTTVDIKGTQGAVGVKLVAHAQAGLTRSSVLRAGDASSAVLADGASFTQCDVNTAITIGKTGADLTVATHVDVQLDYVLE